MRVGKINNSLYVIPDYALSGKNKKKSYDWVFVSGRKLENRLEWRNDLSIKVKIENEVTPSRCTKYSRSIFWRQNLFIDFSPLPFSVLLLRKCSSLEWEQCLRSAVLFTVRQGRRQNRLISLKVKFFVTKLFREFMMISVFYFSGFFRLIVKTCLDHRKVSCFWLQRDNFNEFCPGNFKEKGMNAFFAFR